MAETFFGPWRIRVDHGLGLLSFVVVGSAGADGRYVVDGQRGPAREFEVPVDGDRWALRLEEDDNGTWVPAVAQFPNDLDGPRRSTEFRPMTGLTVVLETGGDSWGHPGDPLHVFLAVPAMRLECVSSDPSTNPIPTPNPYDFTVPHGPGQE